MLAAIFLLLPLVTIRKAWKGCRKTASAVYLASLGIGFMFIEVAVMQSSPCCSAIDVRIVGDAVRDLASSAPGYLVAILGTKTVLAWRSEG